MVYNSVLKTPQGIKAAATTIFLATCLCAHAQGNQIVMRSQSAQSLSGVVTGAGAPMEGVAVAECAIHFKRCVTLAHSDKSGHFDLHSRHKGNVHYLRFLSRGWNEECETITLDSASSGDLAIQLSTAN